jgi:hypothetical protein
MTAEFELDGQGFTALNGGPVFKFNEAVSFQVLCETQEGSRLLLGETRRGRRRTGAAVRLAEGQVRLVLAGHPKSPERMGG